MIISPAEHGLVMGENAPGYERSKGVHMSDLYNSLYRQLEPKRYGKAGDELPKDKLELGMVFEELLERALKMRVGLAGETVWRPGEFRTEEHGIAFSPDLLITNGSTRLGEVKLTWMSARHAPISKEQAEAAGRPELANKLTAFDTRFEKWMTQIRAYLYHLQLTEARLIVFFVNGDYRPPSPVVLAWDLLFEPSELREEWDALVNHGKDAGLI